MPSQSEFARAAGMAREIDLTTYGRKTGRPSRRTMWVTADHHGRVHIRSGQGLARDWPQNLLANADAIVHMNGEDVAVRARRVVDRDELSASHDALEQKYGWKLPSSRPGEALTPPERATFELVPAAHHNSCRLRYGGSNDETSRR